MPSTDVQTEPGGTPEQVSPTGLLQLSPSELKGFRYLTVSVAHLPVCGSCCSITHGLQSAPSNVSCIDRL